MLFSSRPGQLSAKIQHHSALNTNLLPCSHCKQPANSQHQLSMLAQSSCSPLEVSLHIVSLLAKCFDMVLCSQAVHARFPLPACTPTPCAHLEVTDSHKLVLLQPEVLQPDQVAQRSQPLACETAALRHIQEGQRCEALQHLQAIRM